MKPIVCGVGVVAQVAESLHPAGRVFVVDRKILLNQMLAFDTVLHDFGGRLIAAFSSSQADLDDAIMCFTSMARPCAGFALTRSLDGCMDRIAKFRHVALRVLIELGDDARRGSSGILCKIMSRSKARHPIHALDLRCVVAAARQAMGDMYLVLLLIWAVSGFGRAHAGFRGRLSWIVEEGMVSELQLLDGGEVCLPVVGPAVRGAVSVPKGFVGVEVEASIAPVRLMAGVRRGRGFSLGLVHILRPFFCGVIHSVKFDGMGSKRLVLEDANYVRCSCRSGVSSDYGCVLLRVRSETRSCGSWAASSKPGLCRKPPGAHVPPPKKRILIKHCLGPL